MSGPKVSGVGWLLLLVCLPAAAGAQVPMPEPPAAPVAEERPKTVLLAEGTEVSLKLAQRLTARNAVVGEPVELMLAEDLRVGKAVVARAGARVLGTVVEGKATEKRGKAKSLKIRLDFLKVGEARVKLRGEKAADRKSADYKKGEVAAATIIFGVVGLIAGTGSHWAILEGTPVAAFVEEGIELPVLGWEEPAETPPASSGPPGEAKAGDDPNGRGHRRYQSGGARPPCQAGRGVVA